MEIKCTTCGNEVTPLELYDGFWSCPVCRGRLDDKLGNFSVTCDNEELFKQSEILYADWLFNHSGTASLDLVSKAVRLCRQSARMGNPKALARLAYFYDKGYVGNYCSDVMRFKMAYMYYSSICYSGIPAVESEVGAPAVDWTKVREETAYSMLRMLTAVPPELSSNKTYNLRDNLDRVQSELGVAMNFKANVYTDEPLTKSSRMFNVFCSCLNKQRAPLFGAFRVRVGDLIEMYKKPFPGKEDKIPNALYWLTTNKKVLFSYIAADAISDSSAVFSRLSTQSSVEGMLRDFKDEDYLWTFFFNHNGGHQYLSTPQKRDKVLRTIYGRVGTDLLKSMLLNGNQKLYTFYDDDIYQFMKQAGPADATRALVEKICNGGDEV